MKLTPIDVITILGKRGSGKTTLSQALQEAYPRKIIFDRLREYHCSDAIYVETFDQFGQALVECAKLQKFKIIFQFDLEEDNHSPIFDHALRLIRRQALWKSVLLVVEEVHHFATNQFMPHWLKEIILTGRHNNIAVIVTSQRPAEVHKTLLSQSSHIFSAILYEKNDVKYLSSFMGEHAFKLTQLKKYSFLWFQPGQPPKIIANKRV